MPPGRKEGRHRRIIAGSLVVAISFTFGLGLAGQERSDWAPFLERLQARPGQEVLAELVTEVLGRFEQDTSILDPSRTILGCLGAGCLDNHRLVLMTPPRQLVAGRTRSGASRSYNAGQILGLIGAFDGMIARGVEGFFLLKAGQDGRIGLIDTSGVEVRGFAASHVDQVSVTPIPIPDPQGESTLLPVRVLETRVEVRSPKADVTLGDRGACLFSIGVTDQVGRFSGVVFSGEGFES